MRKIAYLIAVVLIAIAQIFPATSTEAVVDLEVDAISPAQTLAPHTEPSPIVNSCLDCLDVTLPDEDKLLRVCSPDNLADNPQDSNFCYADEWVWSCDPDGWCEFDEEEDPTGEGYDW